LYPLEAVLVKELLFLYSPLALYMVRTLGIFIVLFIWYLFLAPYIKGEPRLTFSNWQAKNYKLCFVIALLAVLQMVFTYYGYKHFGVVFTTIVLTLGPILTYIADVIILKERLKKRIVLAAIVILACVAYANIALGR
jgi:drug/metabolite transporter (DMT)-like permease